MITAGYFYKNLSDPIVSHEFMVNTGSFGSATCTQTIPCRVTQPLNAGSAWINGFEAAYLQHLSFLPGALKGLGFSANYGYTASRASLGPDFGRSDHPRLLRNAPNTWNISPTYDRGRVSVRLGLSYNGANIAADHCRGHALVADTREISGIRGQHETEEGIHPCGVRPFLENGVCR